MVDDRQQAIPFAAQKPRPGMQPFGVWPEPFTQLVDPDYPAMRILCAGCTKPFGRPEPGVAFVVLEKRGNFKPMPVRKFYHVRCMSQIAYRP